MTSLIFGTIYMGHKAVTEHRREKIRVKNYERWEGLRDEYDAQRRISREHQRSQRSSLDLQRESDEQKPVLTLRDQQEANDARTGWRPQECWDEKYHNHQQQQGQQGQGQGQRHVSLPSSTIPLTYQPTGATWDTPIPAPLRVSRRSYDDAEHQRYSPNSSANVSGRASPATRTSMDSGLHGSSHLRDDSVRHSEDEQEPNSNNPFTAAYYETRNRSSGYNGDAEPVELSVPGGRMAELLDGMSYQQSQQTIPAYQQTQHILPSMTAGGRMAELIERGY